jgi:hypothetical protein
MPPIPLTVAVNVTTLPEGAGFCEEATVVVLVLVIICQSTLEVLPAMMLSPLYTAVMECGEPLPESAEVLKAVTPKLSKVPAPRLLLPS